MCEYEIAPATPANRATVAPAATVITRSAVVIGHHRPKTTKRSSQSPKIVTTVPMFCVPPGRAQTCVNVMLA